LPDWLLIVVMSLTVYRLTRLVTKDSLPPVLWLRRHLVGGWRPVEERKGPRKLDGGKPEFIDGVLCDPVYRDSWVPLWLADLWSCPWCVSGWIAGVVTLAADLTIGVGAPVFTGFTVWAIGAIMASQDEL
jgi:hypothetical protein